MHAAGTRGAQPDDEAVVAGHNQKRDRKVLPLARVRVAYGYEYVAHRRVHADGP
ncbi:MAG: hypothetical protein MPJ22_00650 [Pirellulales bacterium]|nr:hypothetical protein [Pirellulales bacterium]